MARPSKIDRLPPDIRERIGALRQDGHTIDEIHAVINTALVELGAEPVSRSGLGRHLQDLDALGEEMRQQRVVAAALVDKFGAEPDDKLFRLNVELMQGLLLKANVAARAGGAVALEGQELMFLTSALKNIATASKTDTERVERIERRAADLAKRAAASAAAAVGAERGMSKDTIEAIKASILGVKVA